MGERTIKVTLIQTIRMVTIPAIVSFVASILLWKHIPLSEPYTYVSIAISGLLTILIFQLRFMSHMTVTLWSHLWGSVIPFLAGSLLTLPFQLPLYTLLLMVLAIIGIGIWAAYRFYPLLTDKRLHKSRFARLDEIETLLSRKPVNDGLILGSIKQFFFYRHYVCVRPTKAKKEVGHSLVIAPSGGGKTTETIGQITAFDEYSMIITDPKGELFKETGGARAKKGPVFVLDPTRRVGHCYDPLLGITEEGEYLTIANILVFQQQDSQPFWNDSAANMIVQLLKAARIEHVIPMVYLRHMIDLGLPAVAKRLHALDPKLARQFLGKDIEDTNLDNNTLNGIWSTLQSHLRKLLTETLVRCFTRSDFTAETILRGDRPITIYLRLQEGHLYRLAPYVRLIIETLMKDLTVCWERYQGKGCRNVFFDLEEAGIFPLPNLHEYVSTGRSKGFVFKLYYQALSQLQKNYGDKEASTIMASMDTKEFFRPNDKNIAKEIEDWLGKGSKFADTLNIRQGNELFSESLSEQAIPVMSATDIMEMNDKYVIVKHREFKPMKLHRLKWFESDMLKKRVGLKPPVLPELPHIPPLPEIALKETTNTDIRFVDPDEVIAKKREKKAENERRR